MEQSTRWTERVARAAMAGVLACGLMLPTALMAQPDRAWAADGTVQINSAANNATGYKVYEIFKADIDDADKASNIAWNDAFKDTVLAYLDSQGYSTASTGWLATKGYTAAGTHDDPQNAAEFIAEKIKDSTPDADFGKVARTPDAEGADDDVYSKLGSSFARGLADALKSAAATKTLAVSDNKATLAGEEGYYLIVANAVAGDDAGTAPIWLPLGGSTTAITEKTALPTVAKAVSNDSASDTDFSWAKAADANTGQDLWYRITTTLPANIKSFPSYNMSLVDTLSAGLALKGGDAASVKVIAYENAEEYAKATTTENYVSTGADITSSMSISYSGDALTVSNNDLLSVGGIDGDDIVVVYYQAHVVPTDSGATPATAAAYGGSGNDGTVELTYPSDPIYLTPTKATTQSTKTYSYQLELTKHDKSNGQFLPGARYSVTVSDASGHESSGDSSTVRGKYVQADGSLGAEAHDFTTGNDGKLLIQGLDAGVYEIVEMTAPTSYSTQDAPIYLTITATYDDAGASAAFSASVTGGETASVNDADMVTRLGSYDPGHASGTGHNKATADQYSQATGKVVLMTVDEKQIQMPLTGLPGYMGLVALGLVLVAGGLGGMFVLRRRRDRKASE